MSDTLMELVNTCEKVPPQRTNDEGLRMLLKAERMEAMGFEVVAKKIRADVQLGRYLERVGIHGYIAITQAKIDAFIERKNESFRVEYEAEKAIEEAPKKVGIFGKKNALVPTKTAYDLASDRIFRSMFRGFDGPPTACWEESALKDYTGIPPQHVLDALKLAKDRSCFDAFTIATVRKVKDPLLLGNINGCPDRFFIAQWGDDVCLDDVL